jgi:hypothetical protein
MLGSFWVAEGLLLSTEETCSADTDNFTKDTFSPHRSKYRNKDTYEEQIKVLKSPVAWQQCFAEAVLPTYSGTSWSHNHEQRVFSSVLKTCSLAEDTSDHCVCLCVLEPGWTHTHTHTHTAIELQYKWQARTAMSQQWQLEYKFHGVPQPHNNIFILLTPVTFDPKSC